MKLDEIEDRIIEYRRLSRGVQDTERYIRFLKKRMHRPRTPYRKKPKLELRLQKAEASLERRRARLANVNRILTNFGVDTGTVVEQAKAA